MNPWHKTITDLLQHFDDSEGTTYLYGKREIEEFVKYQDPAIQAELREVMLRYHKLS